MQRIVSLAWKEMLLLCRDMHGLALLFIMPSIFILIMSFALSEQYSKDNPAISYLLIDADETEDSRTLVSDLEASGGFKRLAAEEQDEQVLMQKTREDAAQFLLILREDYKQELLDGGVAIELYVAPNTNSSTVQLFSAFVRERLAKIYVDESLLDALGEEAMRSRPDVEAELENAISSRPLYRGAQGEEQTPTAVQQNVPAWLLFAMFFITIPLSTTLIREREQGTLARLRSMGVANYQFMLGKLIPFFIINLLQVAAMLLVGMYLMPALGADRLEILGSMPALLLISSAAALAAVSYALLVANIAQTTEQATIIAGVCNILMAALGGIMVPRFIMPPIMQNLSEFSPMAWGLDGFLDILLRAGDIAAVGPEAARLGTLALVLLLLASLLSKYQRTR